MYRTARYPTPSMPSSSVSTGDYNDTSGSDYYVDSPDKSRKCFISLTTVNEDTLNAALDGDDEVFIEEQEDKTQKGRSDKLNTIEPPAGQTGASPLSKKRLSTAEVIVALSERRRSTSMNNARSASPRKNVSVSGARKSLAASTDSIDPLRANIDLLNECCNLIRRNRRQLLFNTFLILLVAAILSSMIIFATFTPPSSQFQIPLTPWALFLPLNMQLRLFKSDHGNPLIFNLGASRPFFSKRPPSYCPDDNSKCLEIDTDQGKCWCFNWHTDAVLHIQSLHLPLNTSRCLVLEWRGLNSRPVEVTDCFSTAATDGVLWYGGPIGLDQRWPFNTNVSSLPYKPYLINDVRSNPDGIYGTGEPLWISDNGFGVLANLDYPFSFNLTDSDVCLRSIDISKTPLKYMICAADDARTYTRNLVLLSRLLNSNQYLEEEDLNRTQNNIAGTIFVNLDSSTVNKGKLNEIEERMASLKFKFGFMFEYFDLFNESMTSNVIDILNQTFEWDMFDAEDEPAAAVEISNFVKIYHLEGQDGKIMRDRCIKSVKDTIGVSKWRGDMYACLDLTKHDVSDWFINLLSHHPINAVAKYKAFAGGDADSLPVFPALNVSNEQPNYYATLYTRLAASLPKSAFTDVGFGTQSESNLYVNIATSPNNILSLIPLILSLSLQGYSKFSLNLFNYTVPGDWWRPTSGNTDPLYTWLELAMFAPVFRIPEPVLMWSGLDTAVQRFLPFREPVIMSHYQRAERMNRLNGEPIYKPIWWKDYHRYRSSTAENDETQVWVNDRQFMIGDDLLVAAFLQLGVVEPLVYLPLGRWRNPELQQGVLQGGKLVYIDTIENVACFERVKE